MNTSVAPHDYAAEEAVLGAALLDPEAAQLVAGVDSAMFYPEKHRAVARAIGRLVQRSEPVDGHTVKAELMAAGELEIAGGPAALALLFERGHVAAYVPTYLATLTRLAARRDLIRLGLDMVRSARDEGGGDVQILIAGTFERLLAVEHGTAEVIVPPERLAEELTQTEHTDGIPTGISLIDDHLDGLQAGHLVVLAGRPGLGKTALAVQVAHHVALVGCRPILFCSLEMTRREIGLRLLSLRTQTDTRALRSGAMQRPDVQSGIAAIRRSGFHVLDEGAPQLAALQASIRRGVARHRAALIVVDHIGKVQVGRRESRYLEIGEIAQGLKATAKQLRVPILALAQLNRLVERRNSPRPQLSDLRDSGNVEEEADAVLFLWTAEERHENRNPLPIKLFLAKNRHGDTGECEYRFEKSHGKIVLPARREESERGRE